MHFHLVITTKFGTQISELEYKSVEETVSVLTPMINSFYNEKFKYEDVLPKIETLLMVQGVAAIEGPIGMVVFECPVECRADLSGRN